MLYCLRHVHLAVLYFHAANAAQFSIWARLEDRNGAGGGA